MYKVASEWSQRPPLGGTLFLPGTHRAAREEIPCWLNGGGRRGAVGAFCCAIPQTYSMVLSI